MKIKPFYTYVFRKVNKEEFLESLTQSNFAYFLRRLRNFELKIKPVDWVLDHVLVEKELRELGLTHWDRPKRRTELCDLDYTLSWKIYPYLVRYKALGFTGTPGDMYDKVKISPEDDINDKANALWMEILDDMIFAFKWILDDDTFLGSKDLRPKSLAQYRKEYQRMQRGLNLFAKHYRNLWT